MQFSVTLALLFPLLNVASAALHNAGICIDWSNDVAVYNADATQKACGNYKLRNKGSEQWNTCPDCHIKNMGGMDCCNSDDWHIGGDELEYYCKLNGAAGSYATRS